MDVSSLNRGYVVTPTVVSAPASAVIDSVDTLLPQGSQSVAPVAAASASGSTGNDPSAGGQSQSLIPGQTPTVAKFTRDASTNTLVFMEIDPQTQAVVLQFPDEQSLKLKTYLAEMQRREESSQKSLPGTTVTKTT